MANKIKKRICPKCAKKFIAIDQEKALLPFCSRHCKMIDLGLWLGEKYVVAGQTTSAISNIENSFNEDTDINEK
jgi:endogenous inhibitor of DNA gyrase (YacG/DUF329 family)